MKNTFIAVAALLVIGLGVFMLMRNSSSSEVSNNETSDSAKLDMNVVCESALAYMSFPDAASAELFVEECKEGKHPQVIDQYKAQMNIDSEATI